MTELLPDPVNQTSKMAEVLLVSTVGLNKHPYWGLIWLHCSILTALCFTVVYSGQSRIIVGKWWWRWSRGHGPVSSIPRKYWSSKSDLFLSRELVVMFMNYAFSPTRSSLSEAVQIFFVPCPSWAVTLPLSHIRPSQWTRSPAEL